MFIVSPPDDWAARASARDNSNLNTKRKKLSRKQKDDICEQLTERMGRARDVYSTFRVELRCVLKELGKVCALTLFVPARRTGKPPAGNLLTFGPDWISCLFLVVPAGACKLGEERARTPQTDPSLEQGRRRHSKTDRR